MNKKMQVPKFKSKSEEADWWASPAGRSYVKRKSAEGRSKGTKTGGSSLVVLVNKRFRTDGR